MSRGTLRVFLGAAAGVGKTHAMLTEGRRRRASGADVVVGFVDTHGRAPIAAQIGDLEVVPPRRCQGGGALEEMDGDAVLRRRPAVALVDELAHTNCPGGRNEKRWQDVEELLAAGIDVVSTLNVQHLATLNDVVERITGLREPETIPDTIVRAAEQIELVDLTPEALRLRLAQGDIYAPDAIDTRLANFFRPANLAAVRELTLRWLADTVDEALLEHRESNDIDGPLETKERVVVAIAGAPGGEQLVRRAARMAARSRADLVGVHVRSQSTAPEPSGDALARARDLLSQLGGRYVEVTGGDVAQALLGVARAENASQLVLGATRRSRWDELTRGSVINRVVRESSPVDVHVISHEAAREPSADRRRPQRTGRLSRRRLRAGLVLSLAGPPLLTLGLAQLRDHIELPSALLLFLLLVIGSAAVGGAVPGLVAAVAGFLFVNWFFTPPFHTWSIAEAEHVLALLVFLAVAAVVAGFVAAVSRRSAEAAQARAAAETLVQVAAESVADDPVSALLIHLREAFALEAAAVVAGSDGHWRVEAGVGDKVPTSPADGSTSVPLDDGFTLVLAGPSLAADDRHVLAAFAAQLATALRARRLRVEAAGAAELAEANELRTALLAAVSHDLRTPLSSIKAAVTSLLADDVEWDPSAVREFCEAINSEADRLNALVGNLLDMSRLTTGVLPVLSRPVGVEEIVPAALASLGNRIRPGVVELDVPETLPRVLADPALLERVVANLIDNALTWAPDGVPVRVEADAIADRVDLRIVDRGPGIPPTDRERVFQPFQRLGDRPGGAGVGLGLAVARGFVEVMRGELTIDDTPGGGVTMVIGLPISRGREQPVNPAHPAAATG